MVKPGFSIREIILKQNKKDEYLKNSLLKNFKNSIKYGSLY